MKRTFRVAIILIAFVVLLTGIGLWRHHYLKIMNAEPERVYKGTLLQPNKLPTNANTPKVTPVKSDDNTDVTDIEPSITTQRIDDHIKPEETDNTSNLSAGTIFGDITQRELPPEVVAALKQYEEAHSASADVRKKRKPLSEAKPLDWDAIGLLTEELRQLQQQRKDALEILAQYSDEASKELQAIIAREKVTDQIMDELDQPESDIESDDLIRRYGELLDQATEKLGQVSE